MIQIIIGILYWILLIGIMAIAFNIRPIFFNLLSRRTLKAKALIITMIAISITLIPHLIFH